MNSSRLAIFVVSVAMCAIAATGCQVPDESLGLETIAIDANAGNTQLDVLSPATADMQAPAAPIASDPRPPRDSSCAVKTRNEQRTLSNGDCNSPGTTPTTALTTAPTAAPTTAPTTAPATAPTTAPVESGGGSFQGNNTVDVVAPTPETGSSPEAISSNLLNALRTDRGLGSLARDAEMDRFAREWSQEMASTQDFKHSDGPYGENIAYIGNTRMSAEDAAARFHDMWVNSPGHFRNMTNARYTKIGVGIVLGSDGWYGTHVFS